MPTTRFSQRVRNIAKEKAFGMIRICVNGQFLPNNDDKFSIDIEGPASKQKFDMVREFISKIAEMPNESSTPKGEV